MADTQSTNTATPTVIVEDLHVVYRVQGAGAGKGSATSALSRIFTRKLSPAVREVHAVRGVSFEAHEGDSVGIIGRNGSGKSTLLAAIAGLLPADRGQIYTRSQPTLLGVNAAILRDLSGERNIQLGCLAMGMTRKQAADARSDIVEFSGVEEEFISLPMRTYSTGMNARLRFAIAAARSHDVLLIDEALATGDADFRKRSSERIRARRDEAGTVFLVSHNHGVIRETCNRAIWIDKGTVRMDGPASVVVGAYEASL